MFLCSHQKDHLVKNNKNHIKSTRTYKEYTFLEKFTWKYVSTTEIRSKNELKKGKVIHGNTGQDQWDQFTKSKTSKSTKFQKKKKICKIEKEQQKLSGTETPDQMNKSHEVEGREVWGQGGEYRVLHGLSPARTYTHADACTHKTHFVHCFKSVN